MNKITLFIDTTDRERAKVSLKVNKKTLTLEEKREILSSQIVLSLVQKILKQGRINPSELSEVKVKTGPGSYTGIRVGISIANALSFSLNIPVNGKRQIAKASYN